MYSSSEELLPTQLLELQASFLPPGLELKTSGRFVYLRGTPTRYSSEPYKFTLRATGDHNGYVDKEFSITIANNSSYLRARAVGEPDKPSKPKLATTKIPYAATYSEYNVAFEAGGSTPITWSFTGSLPEGFVSTDTGVIFGIPTQEGKYKFRVTATNSEGSASKSFTLKVLPQKPSITTITIPDGVVGEPYSFVVEADGESLKITKSGKFPKGLKLDKYTGEIYGTPTKAGTYTFKVKAKNKAGKDTVEYTMTISENQEETLSSSSLPENNAAVHEISAANITELYLLKDGQEFDDTVSVAAGTPLTFRVGELPDDDDSESQPVFSGLKVFVNDEELDGAEIASDGTFTIPAGTAEGTFTVYASGIIDGEEFETTEVEIQTAGEQNAGENPESSSGECNIGFAGMFMLMMCGLVLMKK